MMSSLSAIADTYYGPKDYSIVPPSPCAASERQYGAEGEGVSQTMWTYRYDGFGRLAEASATDAVSAPDRALGEVFEYDRNSNILSLERVYAGEPVQLFGTKRVSDRAHIGNRWSNFAGLGWHDNTARWHDAILDRFTTPDPKAADYPSFSPYTHCAANPLRFTDPTGMVVYADDWCVQGILDGLSSEEQKYIQFNNGVLDADLIASCENPSANLEILQALASSSIKYIFNGADKVMLGDNTERALRGNTENGGTVGVTLMPYHDGLESFENTYESPDKDVHIYTSLNASEAKRASNIAHEGYGHGYFYEKSLTDKSFDPFHRYGTQGYILEYDPETQMNMSIFQIGLTNQKLENHIKAVEIRALLNQTINYVFRTINR